MNNEININMAVRALREDAGADQAMVRQALGLKKSNYSDIETGKRILNASELITLLDLFGITLEQFREKYINSSEHTVSENE